MMSELGVIPHRIYSRRNSLPYNRQQRDLREGSMVGLRSGQLDLVQNEILSAVQTSSTLLHKQVFEFGCAFGGGQEEIVPANDKERINHHMLGEFTCSWEHYYLFI